MAIRFIRSSALIVALALFTGTIWAADASSWIPLENRTAPPKLVLSDIKGSKRQLSQFKGKVVVVNFWATWCPPCQAEMPAFAKVYSAYRDRNVEFLGAAWEPRSSRPKVEEFVRAHGVEFPVWMEVSEKDLATFQVGTGLPGTVILDTEGRVAVRIIGETDGPTLTGLLDRVLAEATPAGRR